MADEEESQQNLSEKLNATGAKLAELSSKATKATKDAVSKTNAAVRKAVSDSKSIIEEKREVRRAEKVRKAKEGISSEGLIDDVPPMVTLPEFEEQRMEIVNEQQENQLLLLEHMQKLSVRVDILERRHRARLEELFPESEAVTILAEDSDDETPQLLGTSEAMVEILHILGASMMWVVVLFGLDRYVMQKELMLNSTYPAEIFIWSIGATTWMLYLLYRLTKSGIAIPMLIRAQISLAVGLITVMGIMMNDDSMITISSVWTWGVLISIGLIIGSSMVATAWRSTKRLVGFKDE